MFNRPTNMCRRVIGIILLLWLFLSVFCVAVNAEAPTIQVETVTIHMNSIAPSGSSFDQQVTIGILNISDEPVPLTSKLGRVDGPSGEETYYNLNMKNCVKRMKDLGYEGDYWIREDGCKMFGPYIMCAADLSTRPLGTVLESTLGQCIVADTGEFIYDNPTQIDIATTW